MCCVFVCVVMIVPHPVVFVTLTDPWIVCMYVCIYVCMYIYIYGRCEGVDASRRFRVGASSGRGRPVANHTVLGLSFRGRGGVLLTVYTMNFWRKFLLHGASRT
jgi:hypothetical protein